MERDRTNRLSATSRSDNPITPTLPRPEETSVRDLLSTRNFATIVGPRRSGKRALTRRALEQFAGSDAKGLHVADIDLTLLGAGADGARTAVDGEIGRQIALQLPSLRVTSAGGARLRTFLERVALASLPAGERVCLVVRGFEDISRGPRGVVENYVRMWFGDPTPAMSRLLWISLLEDDYELSAYGSSVLNIASPVHLRSTISDSDLLALARRVELGWPQQQLDAMRTVLGGDIYLVCKALRFAIGQIWKDVEPLLLDSKGPFAEVLHEFSREVLTRRERVALLQTLVDGDTWRGERRGSPDARMLVRLGLVTDAPDGVRFRVPLYQRLVERQLRSSRG